MLLISQFSFIKFCLSVGAKIVFLLLQFMNEVTDNHEHYVSRLVLYGLPNISAIVFIFNNCIVSKMLCAQPLQVKKERAEREALGALPLYQRTIP